MLLLIYAAAAFDMITCFRHISLDMMAMIHAIIELCLIVTIYAIISRHAGCLR